jgi:hypothetical protein
MISELENHLWQSTLFGCMVALLTLVLRRNRAAVRHGLWLAASVKFLVPFSLLILNSRRRCQDCSAAGGFLSFDALPS